MLRRKGAAALVSAWLAIGSYAAHAGDGNGMLYGAGVGSCGEWLKERKTENWYGKGQWMLGFISAVGVFEVMDLRRSDSNGFAAFADKYCTEHPLSDFSDAVRALLQELRIPSSKSPRVE